MKIALLTYHYGYNEGTLLQAYATQALLQQEIPGAKVEIVDWRNPSKEKIVFGPAKNAREFALRDFFDSKLSLSEVSFSDESPIEAFEYVKQNYDTVVVGSDELWRLKYSRSRWLPFWPDHQTNPWAPPFPNLYWPNPKDLRLPCLSIATSISEEDLISQIPRRHKRAMKSFLEAFDSISVRDSRTEQFVNGLLGTSDSTRWLPDPTFFLTDEVDAARPRALSLLEEAGCPNDTPIALLVFHSKNRFLEGVISECKRLGMVVVCLTHSIVGVDVDLSEAAVDPFMWAALHSVASTVVTDRFHGTVFALKGNTPLIALDYRLQLSGNDSKIKDLLLRFDILDRWYPSASIDELNMSNVSEQLAGHAWPAEHIDRKSQSFGTHLRGFVGRNMTRWPNKQLTR